MDTVACPRCRAKNPPDAMNCAGCRINLKFALEHPAEVERIKHEGTSKERPGVQAPGEDVVGTSASKDKTILLPVVLLFGSFVFAFCLGEAIHELGHFLAHRAYGVEVGLRLDPLAGRSRILHGSSAPGEIWGITSAAGPLLNLVSGVTVSLSLWPKRKPALLPLLIWCPVALVQEGVTFSLGLLTPGGDAELIVDWGVPTSLIVGLGVLFLALGVAMLCWILPLVNLSPADSFGRRYSVVAGGMTSFMLLRLLCASVLSPGAAQENAVPLVFSLLLGAIVAVLYGPLYLALSRLSETELASVAWPAVVHSMALSVGMVGFQIGLSSWWTGLATVCE